MVERRAAPRVVLNAIGSISIDEHRSLPCLVYDRSATGVRITLPDAESVPDLFLLRIEATDEFIVCRTVWRRVDEIGAHDDSAQTARRVRASPRLQPIPA